MYACVYFQKDATLSVVHEKDKDLTILSTFQQRDLVEMRWRVQPGKIKETFAGVIVKVGENEKTLTEYATKAYNAVLKGVCPGSQVPEELFEFNTVKKAGQKRERIPTKRIEESKLQNEELTPKKKKRSKSINEKANQETANLALQEESSTKQLSPNEPPQEKKATVTSLLQQFNAAIKNRQDILPSSAVVMPTVLSKTTQQDTPQTMQSDETVQSMQQDQAAQSMQSDKTTSQLMQPDQAAQSMPSEETVQFMQQDQAAQSMQSDKTTSQFMQPDQAAQSMQSDETVQSMQQDQAAQSMQSDKTTSQFMQPDQAAQSMQSDETVQYLQPDQYTQSRKNDQPAHSMSKNQGFDVNTPTGLTDTWRACNGALNLLGLGTSGIAQMVDDLPVASTSVIATLRGLANPEFIHFIQRLTDHMENSACPHTCLKAMEKPTEETCHVSESNGGYLSQLEEASTVELTQTLHTYPGEQKNPSLITPQNTNQETPRRTSPRKQANISISSPYTPDGVDQRTPKRTSPRKQPNISVSSPATPDGVDQVKLLPTSNLSVGRQALRKACHTATKKKHNAAFHLMYGLLSEAFTIEELAMSRGLGVGRARPGEEDKPVLNREKIAVLKEYVNSWCKKNTGLAFPDKMLNDAVTERCSYARKQLKKIKK